MPIPPAASYISGPLQPQLLHIVLYASALLKYENHISCLSTCCLGKYFVASYSLLSMGSLAQQIYLLELVREAVTLYTVLRMLLRLCSADI